MTRHGCSTCLFLLLGYSAQISFGFQTVGRLRASATSQEQSSVGSRDARGLMWDRKFHGVEKVVSSTRRISMRVPANGSLRNLQWLHFPKAGTSFIATLWGYACGQGKVPLDLAVDHNAAYGCGQCYDQALMDRYPLEDYCTSGVLADDFQVQHEPVALKDVMNLNVVGLFRKPNQRLISAYNDHLHASGFSPGTVAVLKEACDNKTVEAYARFPGIAGCSARMLTGRMCTEDPLVRNGKPFDGGRSRVRAALKTVKKMAFVGLTEEWDESVCLFHRMFGGDVYEDEFKNFHQGTSRQGSTLGGGLYDESVLEGFVDEADEAVYKAAKTRFEELRRQYGGGANVSLCTGLLSKSDQQEQLEEGRSGMDRCADMGRECGVVAGTVDCGSCPHGRLSLAVKLPSEAVHIQNSDTVTCSAVGQCLVDGKPVEDLFSWHLQSSML